MSRPPALVHVDSVSTEMALASVEPARARGMEVILLCPIGAAPTDRSGLAAVVELPSMALPALRAALGELDRRWAVRALACPYGPFHEVGFLAGDVATLRAERGLAGPSRDALRRATNKLLAREALDAAGVPDVPFALVEAPADLERVARQVGFPCILKPITGVGASLVYRCDDAEQARAAFREACERLPRAHHAPVRMAPHEVREGGVARRFDPRRSMLAEAYLPGREVSVECLALDDRVVPLLVHDKLDVEETAATVLEHLLVCPPARFTPAELRQLEAHATACVEALGLRRVLCHVELRWDPDRGPRLLEVNPRIGAGCVTDSLRTFLDVDSAELELALLLGETPALPGGPRTDERHAMIFLFSPRSGVLEAVEGLERLLLVPGVRVVRRMAEEGRPVGGDVEESFVAGVWARSADAEAARRLLGRVRERVRIHVR
ncbi:MAG TPA: ATP-grasp domain-containing protein [Polyangiaceae bacterium LLY-WYZ-15_(1-7)]|nr:hypothetical protein [Myxococcales bacterium]MAT27365.1 hypothetical protein [Sandaracinus sp.]HJL04812.1 ATP-grasp domain-containing protein [Polyangiaceae bacterium LLY-WYZ-15_(1-7)]MBJ72499.1 hypothetical protein [Sandaracinus sp.]HJL09945.1 ATP-grasp domain-containing protein [Polyangiaceae bacterium LLY-WYZ-15_(1-7)]